MNLATTGAAAPDLRFRTPRSDDGSALWSLARANGLDENSPYSYLLWTEYFAETSVVTTTGGSDQPIGFITGFCPPADPDTVFVWQVGVDHDHRRKGIAGQMLDQLFARCGATHLEATVTPSNVASETLFRRFGERHGASVETQPLFTADQFPSTVGDHEAEIRFRIGPTATDA